MIPLQLGEPAVCIQSQPLPVRVHLINHHLFLSNYELKLFTAQVQILQCRTKTNHLEGLTERTIVKPDSLHNTKTKLLGQYRTCFCKSQCRFQYLSTPTQPKGLNYAYADENNVTRVVRGHRLYFIVCPSTGSYFVKIFDE